MKKALVTIFMYLIAISCIAYGIRLISDAFIRHFGDEDPESVESSMDASNELYIIIDSDGQKYKITKYE